MGDKTFVRITNQNIYDEIIKLKDHVKTTNGKVKLNKWIATTALGLALLLAGLNVSPAVMSFMLLV